MLSIDVLRPVPWIALAATFSFFGCGGTTTGGGTDAAIDQTNDQATGGDGGGGQDGGSSGPCPVTIPTDGSSCSLTQGFQCEYGPSFWAYCDGMATCTGGKWSVAATQSCPFDEGTNNCPAQAPAAGGTCSPEGASCNFPSEQCNCTGSCGGPFDPDAGIDWKCTAPDPSCPWPRPRFGSACNAGPNVSCSYDICCSGSSMQCQSGYWQGNTTIGGCP